MTLIQQLQAMAKAYQIVIDLCNDGQKEKAQTYFTKIETKRENLGLTDNRFTDSQGEWLDNQETVLYTKMTLTNFKAHMLI